MHYLTFDESNALTGCYNQALHPDHAGAYIECTAEQAARWTELVLVDGELQDRPAPDPADLLAAQRERIWEAIKGHRQRLSERGGYLVDVGGEDKWFHSDPASKIQQLGLARKADRIEAAAGDMDAPFAGTSGLWKTMNSTMVVMTGNVAQAVFAAAEAQEGALFTRAEIHRLSLLAAPDPEAYDWSTGWPAVYPGSV